MNCKEALPLMHEYLDGDLIGPDALALKQHLMTCPDCSLHFRKLEQTEALVKTLPRTYATDDLTARIIGSLPPQQRRRIWTRWVKRHPAISVASVFLLVMLGSFMSFWNQSSGIVVKVANQGDVVIEGNTVTVPAGHTVNGDLVVQGGNVEVKGEVTGNLVVIDGSYNLASTAHIAGKIQPVDQAAEWLWYKVNEWFSLVSK